MLVAYLRGHLKPTLPIRNQSRLREELLLMAMDSELQAQATNTNLIVESNLVQAPTRSIISNLTEKLNSYSNSLEFNRNHKDSDIHQNEREKFVQLYRFIKNKGILQKVEQEETCKQVIIRH